jgi:hypothetical protein
MKMSEQSWINTKAREERRSLKLSSKIRHEEKDHDATKLQAMKGTTNTTKATLHQDLSSSLEDEAQCLVGETSKKFVPQPNRNDIIVDVVNGLRRFKDSVRWKDFHRAQQEEKEKRLNIKRNNNHNIIEIEDNQEPTGLKTGLKPTKINMSAPIATDEGVNFLQILEDKLINQVFSYDEKKAGCKVSSGIRKMQKRLMENSQIVVIPTDKTNSFKAVPTDSYIK